MDAVSTLGVTELTPQELASIDGGIPAVAIAAYLVGCFLTGVTIGQADR